MSNPFKALTLRVWRGEKEEKNGGGGAGCSGWKVEGAWGIIWIHGGVRIERMEWKKSIK